MSPAPAGAQLNKPGIDSERSAQPHTDREGSLVWSPTPQWEEITSNGAWPCFHLPSTAWRWGTRRSRLWGSKLGEPCPVQCQCVQQPTPHRLVVQDRKALECPEFGQRRWPVGLCLLQECGSPSQPARHGQTVPVHAVSVCARAKVAWLRCPVCAVHTLGCHKSLQQHGFTVGHGHCLQLAPGVGALLEEGSAPWCSSALGSPFIHRRALGRQLEPVAVTWPGPPVPRSDRGCLSPSRVPAGPGPHPLE